MLLKGKHIKMKGNLFCKWFLTIFLCVHVLQGTSTDDEEINRQLKVLNKVPIMTIKTQYGDIFDCVEAHKQPAFDHPLLKNHKFKSIPDFYNEKKTTQIENTASDATPAKIGINGTGCPFGTVPIRRTNKEQLIYLQQYLKDRQAGIHQTDQFRQFNHTGYNYYRMMVGVDQNMLTTIPAFYGISARLNIWPLYLTGRGNASSIAVYLENGYETIEAGWMVNPYLFGDSRSRLYTAWSLGVDTGCENILCPGFVQVHKSIPLGVTFDRMSVMGGPQYEIRIQVKKYVGGSEDWWLLLSDQLIGYWPRNLFRNALGGSASFVAWGGTTRIPVGTTTAPPMGSGMIAEYNFRRACYIRRVQILNFNSEFFDAPSRVVSEKVRGVPGYCYTIRDQGTNTHDGWRRHMYVGGPGC